MALEPWTTYPDNLEKATELGTSVKLAPGASLEAELKAVAFSGIGRVSRLDSDGCIELT